MTQNMGALDRSLRAFVVAPVAVLVGLLLGAGTVGGIVLFVVAGVMLVTAATGFCPTYALLGISTHPSGVHRIGRGARAGHA